MLQDLGEGLGMIAEGIGRSVVASLGIALGIAKILLLVSAVLAVQPVTIAWGGFQLLCSMTET